MSPRDSLPALFLVRHVAQGSVVLLGPLPLLIMGSKDSFNICSACFARAPASSRALLCWILTRSRPFFTVVVVVVIIIVVVVAVGVAGVVVGVGVVVVVVVEGG